MVFERASPEEGSLVPYDVLMRVSLAEVYFDGRNDGGSRQDHVPQIGREWVRRLLTHLMHGSEFLSLNRLVDDSLDFLNRHSGISRGSDGGIVRLNLPLPIVRPARIFMYESWWQIFMNTTTS